MAQHELHAALEARLRRALPGFRALVAVERLSGGASQETYRLRVEDAAGERLLALRRAPGGADTRERGLGGPGLAGEARLLEAARAAGVPAPAVLCTFDGADALGVGFAMEWLDGETLGARIARSEALAGVRPRLARECGRILARIHAIDLARSGLRGSLEVVEPEGCVRRTWERYLAYDLPQPMIDYGARWLLANLPEPEALGLVHGDFRNGNLMVTADGVAAVLDWELAHVGDPLRDLGWLCTPSWRYGGALPVGGFGVREDLLAGYAEESGRSPDPAAVHFWEVFGSFWWAVASLEMAVHSREGPDRSVERAAIGRRTSEAQLDCANALIPGPARVVEAPAPETLDLPRADELLARVREHLGDGVAAASPGRARFLARVAANAIGIVERELALGPAAREAERTGLQALLGERGELAALRRRLCERLRASDLDLGDAALAAHLRATAVNQVAIDQPGYAGLATALEG